MSSSLGILGPSSSIVISIACGVERIAARARLPYLTALSIRLVGARFKAAGWHSQTMGCADSIGNRKSGIGYVVNHAGKKCGEIGSAARLSHCFVTGELQCCGDHGVHFGNAGQQLVSLSHVNDVFRANEPPKAPMKKLSASVYRLAIFHAESFDPS